MRNSSRRKTSWKRHAAILLIFAMNLSGCAGPTLTVPEKPIVPELWLAPQTPDAKNCSEEALNFLRDVQSYFNETPPATTP